MPSLLRRCHECGHPVSKKEKFCPRCGAKLPREPKSAVRPLRRVYHAGRREEEPC